MIVVVTAIMATALTACEPSSSDESTKVAGEPELCTLIGCAPPGVLVVSDNIRKVYPTAKRLRACADQFCQTSTLERTNIESVRVGLPYTDPQSVAISVSVLGANSRVLDRVHYRGKLERSFPNGRKCDEGCLGLTVLFDVSKGTLTTDPKRLQTAGLDPSS